MKKNNRSTVPTMYQKRTVSRYTTEAVSPLDDFDDLKNELELDQRENDDKGNDNIDWLTLLEWRPKTFFWELSSYKDAS